MYKRVVVSYEIFFLLLVCLFFYRLYVYHMYLLSLPFNAPGGSTSPLPPSARPGSYSLSAACRSAPSPATR